MVIYKTLKNYFQNALLFLHLGVMPPDEYYYNVNNSVYTNTVAKLRYLCESLNIIRDGTLCISWQPGRSMQKANARIETLKKNSMVKYLLYAKYPFKS